MHWKTLVASIFLWCFTYAVDITQDTVLLSPINLQLGSLHVYPDVYYSIVNNLLTAITGNLQVDSGGAFYVTATNLLAASASLTSGTLLNNGDIAFNSTRSTVVSSYSMISIGSFVNNGNMWLGTASFSLTPPITLGSATSFTNNGKIYMRQERGLPSLLSITNTLGT
ncbi:CIC11C00000001046, partial [Sungouiella intermedia]